MKHTVPIKANIHNRFDIEVVRDGKTVQKAYAENIILNALWTRMFAPATWNSYIFFGTGTGALSASRTSLFTHLGYKGNSSKVIEDHHEDGYFSCRHRISLAPEEYVGQELSEVGIGYGTSSTNLVTHATLKDMNGNPTTIEKTALDFINIYATVYLHIPTDMAWESGGIILTNNLNNEAILNSSTLLNVLFGVAAITIYTSRYAFSAFKQSGAMSNDISSSKIIVSNPSAVNCNSATKTMSVSRRLAVGTANFADGIGEYDLYLGTGTTGLTDANTFFIVDLTNPNIYAGSTRETEPIGVGDGVTEDFQTAYQIKPGSTPEVKVDGTPVSSGVTVDVGRPVRDDISSYLKTIARDFKSLNKVASWGGPNAFYDVDPYGDLILENTLWPTYGIYQISMSYGTRLSASNDLVVWNEAAVKSTGQGNVGIVTIPETYRNYRYWKVSQSINNNMIYIAPPAKCLELVGNTANIHFATPPDVGAVITVDYVTPWVAKDTNHVFDLTFELQFGEYTP